MGPSQRPEMGPAPTLQMSSGGAGTVSCPPPPGWHMAEPVLKSRGLGPQAWLFTTTLPCLREPAQGQLRAGMAGVCPPPKWVKAGQGTWTQLKGLTAKVLGSPWETNAVWLSGKGREEDGEGRWGGQGPAVRGARG